LDNTLKHPNTHPSTPKFYLTRALITNGLPNIKSKKNVAAQVFSVYGIANTGNKVLRDAKNTNGANTANDTIISTAAINSKFSCVIC
jgi:hypothetical protein